MKPTRCEPKYITVIQQVDFKAIWKTTVLVSTQMTGLIKVAPHERVAKTYACMTAREIMDAYSARRFYNIIARFGTADVNQPTHQILGEAMSAQQKYSTLETSVSRTSLAVMRLKWQPRECCTLQAHSRPREMHDRIKGHQGKR